MAKDRIAHIDMAAGIMILYMMYGHIGASDVFVNTSSFFWFLRSIFFFFMPWFFYKSGMFFSVSEQTNRGGGKFLKPFVVWSMVGYFVYAIIQLIFGTRSLFSALLTIPTRMALFQNLIPCNKPIWFLLTLYCVINIANFALRRIHPLILSIIGMAIGFLLYVIGYELIPDIFANTATGLCFFCLGYMMQGKEINKTIVGIAFVGYLISIFLLHSPFVDMRINTCGKWLTYLLWFPASLSGIIVLNTICRLIIKIYNFPILRYVGKNAMAFLVSHYIVFYVVGLVLYHTLSIYNLELLKIGVIVLAGGIVTLMVALLPQRIFMCNEK